MPNDCPPTEIDNHTMRPRAVPLSAPVRRAAGVPNGGSDLPKPALCAPPEQVPASGLPTRRTRSRRSRPLVGCSDTLRGPRTPCGDLGHDLTCPRSPPLHRPPPPPAPGHAPGLPAGGLFVHWPLTSRQPANSRPPVVPRLHSCIVTGSGPAIRAARCGLFARSPYKPPAGEHAASGRAEAPQLHRHRLRPGDPGCPVAGSSPAGPLQAASRRTPGHRSCPGTTAAS